METTKVNAQYKVVVTGVDIATDRKFCVIRKGSYTKTAQGVIAALKDGMFDKTGDFSPEFEAVVFLRKHASKVGDEEFALIVKQLDDNGRDIAALYNTTVQFKTIKHNA